MQTPAAALSFEMLISLRGRSRCRLLFGGRVFQRGRLRCDAAWPGHRCGRQEPPGRGTPSRSCRGKGCSGAASACAGPTRGPCACTCGTCSTPWPGCSGPTQCTGRSGCRTLGTRYRCDGERLSQGPMGTYNSVMRAWQLLLGHLNSCRGRFWGGCRPKSWKARFSYCSRCF